MGTLNIDADNYGMNDVKNMGFGMNLVTGSFDFDSSYPSGGEDFDLSNYFHKDIVQVQFEAKNGYVFEYDKANDKVIAYTAGSEVADTTDLSSLTDVKFIAIGY